MCGIALLLQRSQPGLPSDGEQGASVCSTTQLLFLSIQSIDPYIYPILYPPPINPPGWLAALREAIHPRGPDVQAEQELRLGDWGVHMLGAVLYMRGPKPRCVCFERNQPGDA